MASPLAHVERSNTSKRPFLSLEPLNDSLTEGTSIPPPPAEADLPPATPSNEKEKVLSAGPLSSHPVTPSGENAGNVGEGALSDYSLSEQGSEHPRKNQQSQHSLKEILASDPPPGLNGAGQASANNEGSMSTTSNQHQHKLNSMAHSPSSDDPPAATKRGSRRASFADRFFRKPLGSIRGLNGSRTSGFHDISSPINAQNDGAANGQKQYATVNGPPGTTSTVESRGVKRPASPGGSSLFTPVGGPADRGSQSFPRMVRKKSMELFGSARRMSGMWGKGPDGEMGDDNNRPLTMDEIAKREEQRRESLMDGGVGMGEYAASEGDRQRMSRDSVRLPHAHREPPPTLPEVKEDDELDGEAMFQNIGRD
ncbi:MAG: hypothetical protein M1831_002622 [Alyxoria varia]|nr:MAG: hypothetical protein M1831_002622 [Alyxoria varia]